VPRRYHLVQQLRLAFVFWLEERHALQGDSTVTKAALARVLIARELLAGKAKVVWRHKTARTKVHVVALAAPIYIYINV
jgi:hypothetical protein